MKRTGLQRKTGLKRKTRLRPVSDTKAAWNDFYRRDKNKRLAQQVAKEGRNYCERCDRTCRPQGHHQNGQAGANIMNYRLICWQCHDWIHFTNPNEARKEGFLV